MPDTAIEYLVGSTVRPDTLAVLRDHGRLSLRALEDQLSASRRTVKRTLSAMESRGWVRPVDGTYELTAFGAMILSAYEEFRECERTVTRLRPFLEHVPARTFDLGVETVADATVISPEDDPTAFVDRLVELRAGTSRLRQYTPFLLLDSVRQLAEQVRNGQSTPDVMLVLGTDAPPQASPEYAEQFETLADAPSVDIRLYSDGPPIGFGVADGHAFFGAADSRDIPHSLLVSDAPGVVAWVEREFEAYFDAAEPLSTE